MHNLTDVLFNQFRGRVDVVEAELSLPAPDNVVADHLVQFVRGDSIPSLAEFRAAEALYIAAVSGAVAEHTAAKLEAAVDTHIDSVARADKWDSRITCVMRAGYPNPWQARAAAFGAWMDSCYAYCYQVQADVAAGTRVVPTEAELIAELPVMVWPG